MFWYQANIRYGAVFSFSEYMPGLMSSTVIFPPDTVTSLLNPSEFERLKTNEAYQEKIDWQANRILSKLNYVVHTDAVKTYIVPTLTEAQKKFVYAEEADVLNVALFGMTAKEWRDNNPKLAKEGNMRDYTDLLHLVILNNLQNTNAELIEEKVPQRERLVRLNNSARRQMKVLKDNKNIKELELLQKQVNEEKELLID